MWGALTWRVSDPSKIIESRAPFVGLLLLRLRLCGNCWISVCAADFQLHEQLAAHTRRGWSHFCSACCRACYRDCRTNHGWMDSLLRRWPLTRLRPIVFVPHMCSWLTIRKLCLSILHEGINCKHTWQMSSKKPTCVREAATTIATMIGCSRSLASVLELNEDRGNLASSRWRTLTRSSWSSHDTNQCSTR